MQKILPQKVHDSIKEHLRQKRWRHVVTAMACAVVFCTTYALILPAITMTGDTYCGHDEHTHNEECYERVLVCGLEETEATSAHTHTDECYKTESVLVCGKEESAGHTHGEDCYDEEGNLTCGLEESTGHTHDASCYQEERVLICTESTEESIEGHVHTDDCYEKTLVCQLEEHTHSLACYSNPEADVESASVWERTLPTNLGDNWAENVVAVANSQLGYTESTANYTVLDDGVTTKGYTRYGAWYGDPYGDWCAMFASFCLKYAGVPSSSIPYEAGCANWVTKLQKNQQYATAAEYTPVSGDLIFFDTNSDGLSDHVGIVTEVTEEGKTIKTVEGNSSDTVAQRSYAESDSTILGYGTLPENPDAQKGESNESDDSNAVNNALPADAAQINSSEDSIAVGETKTLSVEAGEIVRLPFVPEYTHEYVFYSSTSGDTYGYLYDANVKQLTANDDGGDGHNFKIAYTLIGGETYYWGTKWYSSSTTGDIPVHLELGAHSYSANDEGKLVCICGAVAPLSGTCGENLQWSFDNETGTLSITGSGTMTNYTSSNKAPWSHLSTLIRNVSVGEEVTSIGAYAFYGCTALEAVALPSALRTIGSNAFYHCTSLTSVDLSQTAVDTIGSSTFSGCSALETATFPGVLKKIGDSVFGDCASLISIDLSGTAVTAISGSAFYGCKSLTTVMFPNALNKIEYNAFRYCSSLTSVDLSGTAVTSIGNYAFAATGLETAMLSKTLVELKEGAFYKCTSLMSVDLSQTAVETITNNTFSGCSKLETVMFPNKMTKIDSYAFSDCKSLERVDLSGTAVTSIGNNAFASCDKLETIALPPNLSTLGSFAFSYCRALASIDLSNTKITSIEDYTFQRCSALKSVTLPDELTQLGDYAFYGCSSLPSLVIPETVTSVGKNVLMSCQALIELRLEAPEAVFNATQSKTNGSFHVTVADTVNVLSADTMTALNNMGCASISFEGPNYLTVGSWQADFLPDCLIGRSAGEYFADTQGVLYRIDSETNTASVFYCPAGIENYTVLKELPAPEGKESTIPVTGVDSFAFADAADLTELSFAAPEAITTLADRAFGGATKLEKINEKTTATDVRATFTNKDLTTGSLLFWQTKISDTAAPSKDALVVEKEHLKLTVSTEQSTRMDPAQMADGTYLYYTGETAQTTITVSADSAAVDGNETVVRVYFQFDSKNGKLNYSPGTYTVVSDSTGKQYALTVVKTDMPNCYYVELERPEQGDTISFRLESSYPSPTSSGGDAALWCGILTGKEKETLGSGVLPIKNHQSLNWSTKPDTFPVTKSESSTGSSKLVGDGEGSAYISGLTYAIKMSRVGTTLEGMGKDHMSSVDFVDVLTLPDGVTLAEDVLEAIRTGTVQIELITYSYQAGYHFKTTDGRTFLIISPSITYTNYKYLQNGSVSVDENGNLVVRWGFRNANLNTEMSDMTFTYKVADNTLIVKEPQADVTYTVENAVTATEHFMYSADQEQKDECSVTVKEASSSLEMDKSTTLYSNYYGEQRNYRITASNPGALPYEGLAYITDDLRPQHYMRPADLASTFTEDADHQLAVTITNATFCKVETVQSIAGIDGSTGTTDPQNSGSSTTHSGMSNTDPDYQNTGTITISWGTDGKLQISTGDSTISCAAEKDAIKSALQSLGFVVTAKTQYCLSWDLRNADGTVPPLPGGGKIVKNVYCANKDTFMLLDNDTEYRHPNNDQTFWNEGYGWSADKKSLAHDSTGAIYAYREFELSKNWYMNGKTIDEETTIRQGDILDYSLTVAHKGTAQYDALPLVDHMSGAQVLLAPVAKNSGADWTEGLQTVADNGTEYYILSNPGTYRNVWASETQLAETVEVTQSGSSLDTLIKWYFVNYTGTRTDTVSYRAYVCPDKTALTYSLNNECWLSDRESHRLYASLPGWNGVAFSFDKVIVDEVDDTGEGYRSSNVSEGQTVFYRLSLSSPTNQDGSPQEMTITGKNMYDALPLSMDGYRWSTDNVRITYGKGESCKVTNGENWSVDVPEAGDQQYIKWADDFSITFTGTAYIYVELTFPSGTTWQEYAVKYGTTTLTNTFHVLSAQRSVTHQVSIAAKVYLQKGVYDTGYYYNYSSSSNGYKPDMGTQDDRLYYQNNDAKVRAIKYYVTLYNEGPTNLYLTEMQDLLPKGFTFGGMGTYSGATKVQTETGSTADYVQIKKANNSNASKKTAYVTAETQTTESNRQIVTFRFSQYPNSNNCISYDEDRGMCYLKPGEVVVFCYVCYTNEAADTEDSALNTVTMPYYDFNGGGIVVSEGCSVTGPKSSTYTTNDGSCEVMDNGQVESLGFTGETNDTQWLTSDVTVIRGGIKPGITKVLTSKTDTAGTTELNPVSANPQDTLNWTITTENDGTNSIVDYVLTDKMQSPYMFAGEVSYTIYNAPNDTNKVAYCIAGYLFKIDKGSDDTQLNVTTNRNTTVNVTIDGEPVTLSCNWYYSANSSSYGFYGTVNIQLSITKDKDGNVVMSLRFPDATMAIPEGGNSKLTLSTSNTSGILQNKQFINTCFVTPLTQTWDNTTNKGNITTLDTPYGESEMPTVRNSAPVTTSYGYVTGSSKRVTEVGNDSNTAACTDETNYIVLPDKTKLFRYTLTVDNSTPKAMDKLVLIDGLPEVDDHTSFLISDPRFSEFKVSLAESPNFSVTVTPKGGTATTLNAENYTIEYSTKTGFDSDDWKGNGTEWSENAEGARSIRLKVTDSAGTLIPAGSTISLSFTCKIDGEVQPGQTAWNSFGYHYSLADEAAELEAAPLKVGVKIPSVPELRKQVVDHSGQARTVDRDTTFQFLVYQGAALSGSYTTEEELIRALTDSGVAYDAFTVTVGAGQSLSDSVPLKTDKWTWTDGEKYTIVELPCGEEYSFKRFLNSATNTYTLTYTQAQTQIVTCENTALRWSIDLTKENTSHNVLSGAVFALYSPNSSDQLSPAPEEYADLNIGLTADNSGKTWYLKAVKTTSEDGKLNWSDLLEEQYYLLEVKAPDGYNLNSPAGQILKQENETQGVYSVTVVNRSGYSLPETGGAGTLLFTIGGTLLLAGSLLSGYVLRRKRERRSME